jgi:radical SAM protein with 4Fe4S-binding SPASM domain
MRSSCEQATGLDDRQFWRALSGKIAGQRIPFSGSLALTLRCNLRCVHCYVREEPRQPCVDKPELKTDQWKMIIEEIKEAGCLNLLLTGGEPLLREDFAEIYTHAKKSGFLVTVFTNGTLVTDKILELFRELPPRQVDISLYGATARTYERITGVPGSFRRAIDGIEALLGQGVHVGLKSVLMTLNADEFSEIKRLAQRYGVKFRMDAAIFPALSGDRSPMELRVPPERVVELELADPAAIKDWREYLERYDEVPTLKSAYSCGAGLTTFHVDPSGVMYPCVMARSRSHSLLDGSFAQGWNGEISRLRDEKVMPGFRCIDCQKKLVCGFCPGFFERENGRNDIPSEYLCELGRLRHERITRDSLGG